MNLLHKMTTFRIYALALLLIVSFVFASSALAQSDDALPLPKPPAADDVSIGIDELQILLVPLTGSDLAEMATTWQSLLKSSLSESALLNLSLRNLEGSVAENVRVKLADTTEVQKDIRTNYTAVLDAWEAKGAAPEEVQPHRSYITALTVAAVRTIDAKTALLYARDWAVSWDGGLGLILQGLLLGLAIWALMLIARVLKRTTKRGLDKIPNLSRLLQAFIVNCVYWLTFVLGIVVVLGLFGVNVTPLFAVFGGLSFILGFALQDTLGNLASGLMIMVLKPFDTGDYIQVGGSSGFVDEMSIVSTRIRTFDNQIIVVPNSKIWGDVITNVSASPERRVDLVFGIGYSDNAQHAIEVLKELVAAHPMCLAEPEPEVFVGELGDNSVNIFCRPWSKSDDYWAVYWGLTGQAKERFDEEGISIPFPQRDVHLISQS